MTPISLRANIAALVLITACAPAAMRPTTAPAPAPVEPVLAVGDVTIYVDDKVDMHLGADGHLEAVVGHDDTLKLVAILTTDGTITSVSDPSRSAHVARDGTLSGPAGQIAPIRFEGATLIVGDKHVAIDDKGMVRFDGSTDGSLRVDGASNDQLKRTVLILLSLLMKSPT